MKKWLPFIVLLVLILVSLSYLFLLKEDSEYVPQTDKAAIIYREACKHCHGEEGQGSGLFYPAFDERLDSQEIYEVIQNGALLMPAFNHIKGDTLDMLVKYIQSLTLEKQ
jgi:mono/diheme cytochrome c family protein